MQKMKFWGGLFILASHDANCCPDILKSFFESYNNPPEEKDPSKIAAFCDIMMTDLYSSG